ncbi:MAG TPA: putative Ig domain-containing protein [Bryobacteraceae bacterium]|nr:putative Ig domain-containing protein [Bryobacteraceae bacterium]
MKRYTSTVLLFLATAACLSAQVSINANSTLDGAAVGQTYSVSLAPAGGTSPYTFSITSGAIPGGMSLSPGGVLSGQPSAAGTFSFTVMAVDANNASAIKSFNLTVSTAPLTFTPAAGALPNATSGQVYQQQFTASGGSGTYTYYLIPPLNWPVGELDIDPTTGLFYGTALTTGSFGFSVEVIDTNRRTATQTYSLTVSASPPFSIGPCSSLPQGIPGATYPTTQINASGGKVPYIFSSPNGSALPPGLSVTADGKLRGTINGDAAGIYQFPISATDGNSTQTSANCTVSIFTPTSLTITTTSPLPTALASVSYSQELTSVGGDPNPSDPVEWSSPNLPSFLSLNQSSGELSGTPPPSAAGDYTFQVQAFQSGISTTTVRTFQLHVASQALTIISPASFSSVLGRPFSQTITASESVPVSSLILVSGTLPPGVTLIGQQIIGTPTPPGANSFSFVLELDSLASPDNRVAQKSTQLLVTVVVAPTITTTSPLPVSCVGASYLDPLTATRDYASPLIWSETGPLPAGITLNSGGILAGFSQSAFNNTFTAQEGEPQFGQVSKSLQMIIRAQCLTVATPSLPSGDIGVPYNTPITAIGGAGPPYTIGFATAGAPPGLTLTNGSLTGTPTQTGTFTFTVNATDSDQTLASRTYQVTISPGLSITVPNLPAGTVNVAYPGAQFTASGGTSPYSWSVASGSLPPGLSINPQTGLVGGTPTTAGTFPFTIGVHDSVGGSATTSSLSIVVAAPLTITTTSLPAGTVNVAYPSTTLTATGGTQPYNWTVTQGSLPPGLNLASSGAITGTPTTAGTFPFTVTVTDSKQASTQAPLQIVVNPAPLTVTPATLPAGTVNTVYPTTNLGATGGTTPYSWTLTGGALPPGLNLSPGGSITGTPTTAGTFSFTATVTDSRQVMASGPFQIAVNPAPLTVTTTTLPAGTVNTPYPSTTLTASGGTTPYTWTIVNGSLPPGLTLSSGGTITGTPTTPGSSQFNVMVTDSRQATAQAFLQITVNPQPLVVTQTALPNGTVNVAYPTTNLNATGGIPPYTWVLNTGSLPPGLSLSSAGVISGTPTTAGTFPFSVLVTDSAGSAGSPKRTSAQATGSFQIIVNPAALTVTPATLPSGTVNTTYPGATLGATGGTPPYSWSITSGALPPGLTISPAGAITGTPTQFGSFPFTATVTDSRQQTSSGPFQIVVSPAPLTVTPATLPQGTLNAPYPATTLTATGGIPPYTWSILTGSLPPGLTLSSAGVISGTPTSIGTFAFTAQVVDSAPSTNRTSAVATGQFQIIVNPAPLTVTPATLPTGVVNSVYPQTTLNASGGIPPYHWTVSAGNLPPGLSLSTAGVITGTPTTAGTFAFSATVTDSTVSDTRPPSATGQFQIVVNPALTVTPATLPTGTVNTPYPSTTLNATGGTTPYSWTISAGALPPGLSLSNAGAISGTPTQAGTFSFTANVVDFGDRSASGRFQIVVNPPPLTVQPAILPTGTVNVAYPSTALSATGGTTPFTWSVTAGALPAGLSLSAAGVISGTPTAAGTFSFTATVTDAAQRTANGQFQIVVNPPALTVTQATLPAGTVNTAYPSTTLGATGGTPPYTWSVTAGALPAGLSLSAAGVISGTPTAAGTFSFTATVTDAAQRTANGQFQIVVNPPAITVTQTALPAGTVNVGYPPTSLTATGGTQPLTWTIAAGSLPPGLSLSAGGVISGTPTTTGTFPFTASVTDASRQTARGQFQIVVNAPTLSVNSATLPSGIVGTPYPLTGLTATGGTPPFSWVVTSGLLPPGLSLSTSGTVSGTPTTAGNFTFGVTVTDSRQVMATGQFQIAIAPGLTVLAQVLPGGTVGVPYIGNSLSATGGVQPFTWSLTSGSLPPGLSLNFNGVISGTPSSSGTFSFTATVTDANRQTASGSFQITVSNGVTISPATLPPGTANAPYKPVQFTTDVQTSSLTWSISGGSLPPGLSLTMSGILQGTPTQAGVFTFTISTSDFAGNSGAATRTIRINPPLTIPPFTLPDTGVNGQVQVTLAANGGTPPFTWTLSGGSLPPGVSLSSNGVITGSPTTTGTFNFTVTVTDAAGATASAQSSIKVTSTTPPLAITGAALATGAVGVAYPGATISASGGKQPFTFAVTGGSLPPGLSLSTTGAITGTPSAAGTFTFTVQVTDSGGATATADFSISIAPAPTITSGQPPNGVVGTAYAGFTFTATSGTPPFTWSASGSLPPGLTLGADGTLSGTPSQSGTFNFTVQVQDRNGATASVAVTIVVAVPPVLNTTTLPSGTVGTAYSQTLSASSGTPPFSWSVSSGTLPDGLSLSSDGVLSGTPTTAGSSTFTIRVTDANGLFAEASFTLQTNLPSISNLTIQGLPTKTDPAQQPKFTVQLANAFPVDITGQLTLTFKSTAVVPSDDPAVQFTTGGRTIPFTIPANQTTAVFSISQPGLQTGTVAGTITITTTLLVNGTDVTPSPAPSTTITVNAGPPVISSVTATQSNGALSVVISGFSTPREVTKATFHFTGNNLQTSDFTVDVSSAFTQWYQSAASTQFGSAFIYTQPFTFQGTLSGSVTVTLANSIGSSNSITAQF